MMDTCEKLYRTMRHATLGLLYVTSGVFGLALCLALLGLRPPAERYAQVAKELAFLFVCMLGLFVFTSLMAAAVRWLAGRSHRPGVTTGKASM